MEGQRSDTGTDNAEVEEPRIIFKDNQGTGSSCCVHEAEVEDQDGLITIGVCAMNKKTLAKPMQNILRRLASHQFIEIQIFSDEVILHQPVDEWPVVDCLVAFYSDGFPLDKAIAYVDLRQPMVVNDLQEQYTLMDRQQVYETLIKNGVEVPKHVVLNRGGAEKEIEIVENDDVIEVGGQVFHKPFVEKPVSAEDHNIYIYFPSDYGGGSQRLFRKTKTSNSAYSKESSVRKDGSYIYEEFLATDGTDVKVHAVGPDYAFADARKSPVFGGTVDRNSNGKETRYPIVLTNEEKLIVKKVCLAFKQTVCGFDLLRANGKSYVCDVNGFSVAKNSEKYYDDCAQILLEMVTAQLAPHLFPRTPPSVEYIVNTNVSETEMKRYLCDPATMEGKLCCTTSGCVNDCNHANQYCVKMNGLKPCSCERASNRVLLVPRLKLDLTVITDAVALPYATTRHNLQSPKLGTISPII